MPEIEFLTVDSDEVPVDCTCYLHWEVDDEPLEGRSRVRGVAVFDVPHGMDQPLGLIVRPMDPGYWCSYVKEPDLTEPLFCSRLDGLSSPPWWLDLLDVDPDDASRGTGVHVGVIDTAVADRSGLEHVNFVSDDDAVDAREMKFISHGETVCRIIGDRSAPAECAAICPAAEMTWISGEYSDETWELGGPGDAYPSDIDPVAVANAIYTLVLDHDVDIINLSLGTFDKIQEPHSGLAAAIDFACSKGVVVVCAAGNTPKATTAFPSRLPQCVSVGAFGLHGWGAAESTALYDSERGSEFGILKDRTIFRWPEGAYGTGLDFIAPGVGIVVSRNGKAAFDVTGTSFAAPLNAGTIAINLAGFRKGTPDFGDLTAQAALKEIRTATSDYVAGTSLNRLFQGKGVMIVA